MAKRKQLDYDNQALTDNLRRSNGKGVDVFFPDIDTVEANSDVTRTVDHQHVSNDADMHASSGARTSTPVSAPEDAKNDRSVPAEEDARMRARTDANMPTQTDVAVSDRKHTSVDNPAELSDEIDSAQNEADVEEARIAAIQKLIRIKRHLSSFTFRFRTNELEELDLVMDELNQNDEIRLSKNDAVRTAVNWLLADYKERKQESILARVLIDT